MNVNRAINEPLSEVDKSAFAELRRCFGDKAIIKKDVEKGGFLVETTLESGIVPGGQKVNMHLDEKDEFFGGYLAHDININGQKSKVIDSGLTIRFAPVTDEQMDEYAQLVGNNPDIDLTVMSPELGTIMWFGSIYPRSFKSADVLASIYHEKGHEFRPDSVADWSDFLSRYERFVQFERDRLYSDKSEDRAKTVPREMMDLAIIFFHEERRANKAGIRLIGIDRELGCDSFPDDQSLEKVKEFLLKTKKIILDLDPELRKMLGINADKLTSM